MKQNSILKKLKFLYALPYLFFLLSATGQDFQLRKNTDSATYIIDITPARMFSFDRAEKNPQNQKIVYRYRCKIINELPAFITRDFSDKDSSVTQVFYTADDALIFSHERITYYYGQDSIRWGGTYYFSNGQLKDFETLGHGKSEEETWNPEVEVLSNYRKARADVLNHLKKITPLSQPSLKQ